MTDVGRYRAPSLPDSGAPRTACSSREYCNIFENLIKVVEEVILPLTATMVVDLDNDKNATYH